MSMIPGSFFGARTHFRRGPFSVELGEPFQDFHHGVQHAIVVPPLPETSPFINARIDWKETPEAHVYKADLPGLNKNEVQVEVEDGRVLCISGEKKVKKEEKTDKWHRVERRTGMFVRRLRLPENAKADKMRVSMENGVLTVTVPKDHEAVQHRSTRTITIDG